MKAKRILILGNSITWHGPLADVFWSGNWGMAASAADKDYVHVLTRAISAITGREPEVLAENIAEFERQYDTYDVAGKFDRFFRFGADLVILAIGENVPALESPESQAKFKDVLVSLMTALKKNGAPPLVVRSCFMPEPTRDAILKDACAAVGGIFVDIHELSKDESNYARSEREYKHEGVAGHPGDKGMQAIADAILAAIRPLLS